MYSKFLEKTPVLSETRYGIPTLEVAQQINGNMQGQHSQSGSTVDAVVTSLSLKLKDDNSDPQVTSDSSTASFLRAQLKAAAEEDFKMKQAMFADENLESYRWFVETVSPESLGGKDPSSFVPTLGNARRLHPTQQGSSTRSFRLGEPNSPLFIYGRRFGLRELQEQDQAA